MKPLKADSQTSRMLNALIIAPCTNAYFVRRMGIFKYTSRISELRKRGWLIHAFDMGDGLTEYILKGRVSA
ncbi:MAG: hypothetical protein FJ119_10805 [Deltaproteobacteria bacterium]|nr:hypothetical protein [Deltaproteobacteria bacterium]